MKIVVAPDSFKGSLTAVQACAAMRRGVLRAIPEADAVMIPMADGGEGTIDSIAAAADGEVIRCLTTDPIGRPITGRYAVLGDGKTAVLEMAEAAGLTLLEAEHRNPLFTSTRGVGQMLRHALDQGYRSFILGIGGSATNDGGAGMAAALGAKLLDAAGCELPAGGGALCKLERIDLSDWDTRLAECEFSIACDVDNPLLGASGASFVFGPQKGATPDIAAKLDQCLARYAGVVRRDMGIDIGSMSGGGAGGGMAAGAAAFLGAKLASGIELVKAAVRFENRISGADLILTGEGRCDAQTVRGKTPYGIGVAGKNASIPVMVIAGTIGEGAEALYDHGITRILPITEQPLSLQMKIEEAPRLLEEAAERAIRLFLTS